MLPRDTGLRRIDVSHKTILLLNLTILVVHFVLALGASDSQVRLLRTTARVACSAPPPIVRPRPQEVAAPAPPRARLVKYLARLPELERLDQRQIAALRRAFERSFATLSAERALGRPRAADELVGAVRRDVEQALRRAAVPEGELLRRLVRIVVSATG